MAIPLFKKGSINIHSEFIQALANKKILRDESQRALLVGPMPDLGIAVGITDDHPLLKFGNTKYRKRTNK